MIPCKPDGIWAFRLGTDETRCDADAYSKPPVLLIACLCARWCNVCEDYRGVFDQVRVSVGRDSPESAFVWLDIDDDDGLLHPLEVEQFPTVLMALDQSPRFFGSLAPQASVLERMVGKTRTDRFAAELQDPDLRAVVAKIHSNLQNLCLR